MALQFSRLTPSAHEGNRVAPRAPEIRALVPAKVGEAHLRVDRRVALRHGRGVSRALQEVRANRRAPPVGSRISTPGGHAQEGSGADLVVELVPRWEPHSHGGTESPLAGD